MKNQFRRFDTADYLENDDDIRAFLDEAAREGDPAAMAAALGAVARARNMTQLARDAGLTREGLYKALSPGGNPSFGTVAKVANALGYRLAFAPASKVEERSPQRAPTARRKPSLPEAEPV